MAETKINGATVLVEDTAQATREGRPVFEWTVRLPDGREFSAADLHGPAMGPEPSEEEMARTFFAFLYHAVEARQYRQQTGRESEGEDLFPAPVVDWAASEDLDILLLSFEEDE